MKVCCSDIIDLVVRCSSIFTGHRSSEPCPDGCSMVPMRDYLTENPFGSTRIQNIFAPVYICSVSQKINALIGSLLRCNSNLLSSPEYHLQVSFAKSGEAVIEALLWPKTMKQFNLNSIENVDKAEEKIVTQKLIEEIDKTISTTTSPRILKSQFELSDQDLTNLLPDIINNQVNVGENSPLLQDPFLPSLMTILQKVPDNKENSLSSRSLLRLVRLFLLTLTEEEKNTMSTHEFLEKFWEEEVMEAEQVEDGIWRIAMINQTLYFAAEEMFRETVFQFHDFPMAGLYHFALSCALSQEDKKIILKRLQIKDCFTLPFNVMILKAFKCPIIVEPVNGSYSWDLKGMNEKLEYIEPVDVPFHSDVSLIEAISLSDKKIVVKSSRSFSYVSSGPERLLPVKKVDTWTDKCYTIEGNDLSYYEEQNNMISRYFSRQNGKLLLAEFTTNYEYPGEEKAAKLIHLYREKIDAIPNSEEKSSVVENERFPELIFTGDEDIVVLRKKAKILKTSSFDQDSYESKFSTVLLFYFPINSIDEMTEDVVERYFDERCTDDRSVSKVKRNQNTFIKQYRALE